MDSVATTSEAIRLQAEEHPLVEDTPPTTLEEHVLRLMHERAYEEAATYATARDVLDVGCNTGYGTLRFTTVANRVVGTDVSPRAIEAARGRAIDGRPEFLLTDGTTLPFADGSFDLVTSFQVIEHLEDPISYLHELARVVRSGGQIILATPNAAIRLDPGMTPWNRFHVREYRAPELQALLDGVFPDVRVRGMFGTDTVYATEIQRVDMARQRTRRKEAAAERSAARAMRPPRPWPIRAARAVIPASVRGFLRSIFRPGRPPAAPAEVSPAAPASLPPASSLEGPAAFEQFSLTDLFYRDEDLDQSMDLLAICRVSAKSVARSG